MRSRPNSWLSTLTQLGFTRKKSKTKQQRKSRNLRVESLEDRRLLAITVDSTLDDNGSGITLREAIGMVTPTNNVIDFDPSLNGDTIKLSNLGELVVDATMTIDASMLDDGITIVAYDPDNQEPGDTNYSDEKDGDGKRIFKISDPTIAGANISVTLRDLTLTGGDVGAFLADDVDSTDNVRIEAHGGAIATDENLTLEGVAFRGNAVLASLEGETFDSTALIFARGGAVYSNGGSLTITGSNFVENQVFASGSNTTLVSDTPDTGEIDITAEGGAISFKIEGNLRPITVQDSTFKGNSVTAELNDVDRTNGNDTAIETYGASAEGGGIHVRASLNATGSDVLIEDVAIRQNSVELTYEDHLANTTGGEGSHMNAHGGGIFMKGGTTEVDIARTTVAENLVTIHYDETVATGVTGSGADNEGGFGATGGGVHIGVNGGLTIDSTTISNNAVQAYLDSQAGTLTSGIDISGGGLRISGGSQNEVLQTTISGNRVGAIGPIPNPNNLPDDVFDQLRNFHSLASITIAGAGVAIGDSHDSGPIGTFSTGTTAKIRHSTIVNNHVDQQAQGLTLYYDQAFSEVLPIIGDEDAVGGAGVAILTDNPALFGNAHDTTLDHTLVANNDIQRLRTENGSIKSVLEQSDVEVLSIMQNAPEDFGYVRPPILGYFADYGLIEQTNVDLADIVVSGSNSDVNLFGEDPDIGPLLLRGGPTRTHALNCGSPAIDAGDPMASAGQGSVPLTDQRGPGFTRIYDIPSEDNTPTGVTGTSRIDIGAFELGIFDQVGDADFDGDMDVDGADFAIWQQGFGLTGQTDNSNGDADGNGVVDLVDLEIWSAQYNAQMVESADFNSDGFVDEDDLAAWQKGYGILTGATKLDGDANGDGAVNGVDFVIWQAQYGQTIDCHQWASSYGLLEQLFDGSITVSTSRDENDGNYSLGDLSLREALELAGQSTGPDTITFATNVHGTIELTQGELDIDTDVDIVGPGSGRLTIDAQSNSRGFNISDGVSTNLLDVSISGLTITGGYIAGSGAGIENDENLELTNVVLTDNVATNLGGAINHDFGKLSLIDSTLHSNEANHGGGVYGFFKTIDSLEIDGSTFSENEATSLGGGLFFKNVDAGGVDSSAKIINSTFSGNTAGSHSGGLRIRGSSQASTDVTIVNSTITGNEAPTAGGVFAYPTATVTMHNSILAGNSVTGSSTWTTDASGNIGGTTSSPSLNNLIGVGNTGLGVSNGVNQNLVGTYSTPQAAGLDVLADSGGPTQTHALLSTSDAIDAGSSSAATSALPGLDFVDQRGYNRNFDDPTQTGSVDIGAYERGLIVTTANDENDVTFDFDDLSLREALAALSNYQANSLPNSNVIEFDDAVVTVGSIQLYDKLDITEDVNLLGPGADQFEIDATGHDSVFDIDAGVVAAISGLQISGGFLSGIKSAGALTLNGVEVSNNGGRGIDTISQSELNIQNSTVSDNGDIGLYLDGTTTTANNVTISGNAGTGAFVFNGTATFINATITENDGLASAGGILAVGSADATLNNSIVAGNTSNLGAGTVDLTGAIGAFNPNSSNNLIGDAGNSGLSDGVTASELGLTSLDYHNGGPTRTHALLNGSVAIDAADDSLLLAFGYLEDQRGSNRYEDGDADGFARADIGAFELAADEFFGTI